MNKACVVVASVALSAGSALGQEVLPQVWGYADDSPRDGVANTVSTAGTFIRETASSEYRAFAEYHMAAFAGMTIQSATLSGQIHVNNSFDNGPRTFNLELYTADGVIALGDFNAPATVVGSTSYHPPNQTSVDFSFDATAAVQAILAGRATHIGVRADPTSSPNFPNVLMVSGASATKLTIVAAPGGGCGTSDFNGDGDFGTDQDIEAFFACLAGNCCATCFSGGADFNGDGDVGTDQDIEAFFRVLAGGDC
jgi:hypothetical protein